MKQKKLQNRAVFWTKEQRAARQEEMEKLHPGYLDMQLRLHVMLGAVLFARGFFHALSIMLGQEAISYVVFAPLSLFIGYCMYSYCMQSKWLAGMFLAFRLIELGRSLWTTLPFVFYLNFIGTVWWVTLVACLLLDIGFLGYLTLSKKGRQQVEYNYIVSSGQTINLRQAAMACASGDASGEAVWYPGTHSDQEQKESAEANGQEGDNSHGDMEKPGTEGVYSGGYDQPQQRDLPGEEAGTDPEDPDPDHTH